jgi:DNA polymerase I-like protein with 3'-5' exonuclease and polymerase domains
MNNSPHDLLPIEEPIKTSSNPPAFYETVVKPLIPDVVRIMANGIPIDLNKVMELEDFVSKALTESHKELSRNSLINAFLGGNKEKQVENKKKELEQKKVDYRSLIKPFNPANVVHRTMAVNYYLKLLPNPRLDLTQSKWTIDDVKRFNKDFNSTFLQDLINNVPIKNYVTDWVETELAIIKAKNKNAAIEAKIKALLDTVSISGFNPNSSKQKEAFFNSIGIHSTDYTKGGNESYNRNWLEVLSDWLNDIITDNEEEKQELIKVVKALIANSYAAIIRNNFIKNFYRYTIDGVLYGNYHLFGTLTFRLTSTNPNLQNMPATGNIYAKPLKRCLVAKKGYLIFTVDLAALEDRVIANLSKDTNKCNIFLENIDGHTLNALSYFRADFEKELPKLAEETEYDYIRRITKAIEEGNKVLKHLRQISKSPTFALNYGAFPPKIAKQIKCSKEKAQEIFSTYHFKLYKGISTFREKVLRKASKDKELHLGLGCSLKSFNPHWEIRTLFNACSQFWNILILLAINKIHKIIDEKGLSNDIKTIATIHDSVYFLVKDNIKTVKILNDTVIPIITQDFLIDRTVPNKAKAEIGYNWYDLVPISNNASYAEIRKALNTVRQAVEQ